MTWQAIKENAMKFSGFIYVPDEVLVRTEPVLVHISDTPRAIFSNMKRIIRKIKPEYIVHTGDMVDNLKIELYPSRKSQYMHDVKGILKAMDESNAKAFVTFGNHDLVGITDAYPHIDVIEDGEIIQVEDLKFMLAHEYRHLKPMASDFKLFGHKPESGLEANELNGIDGIHVIFLKSKKVIKLDYPIGTDQIRTGTSKSGI